MVPKQGLLPQVLLDWNLCLELVSPLVALMFLAFGPRHSYYVLDLVYDPFLTIIANLRRFERRNDGVKGGGTRY